MVWEQKTVLFKKGLLLSRHKYFHFSRWKLRHGWVLGQLHKMSCSDSAGLKVWKWSFSIVLQAILMSSHGELLFRETQVYFNWNRSLLPAFPTSFFPVLQSASICTSGCTPQPGRSTNHVSSGPQFLITKHHFSFSCCLRDYLIPFW